MAGWGTRVLIVGGGFSGMSAAIQLRKTGASVDLVEIDPGWRSYGAGITVGGAALRAFRTLGILDEFLKRGAASDGVDLLTSGGHPIASLPTPRLARPDVPGGGAIMRPVLAAILAEATKASGTNVRLNTTFERIEQDANGARVHFSDGSNGSFDLVVGADGLNSPTRAAVFPDAPKPRYTGQCVWRAVVPRLPEVNRPMMWLGHKVKAGVNPVSRDQMYLFVTEDRPSNDRIDPARFVALLKTLIAPFAAPIVKAVHDALNESSHSSTGRSRRCCCRGPGRRAASSSSAMPSTRRPHISPPAPASASRTRSSSPTNSNAPEACLRA
jgi:2-polyprenyl-6-methoxyphenol hydroxylase-like FAD-dependent oxidoreductase